MSQVQAIPEGYSGAIPYLTINNAADAIGFYQKAFGAELILKMELPGGGVMHAEMRVGQALFMLSEQSDEWGTKSPPMLNGTPVGIMIYVPDVDALVEQAVAAGATLSMPPTDQFYGDRMACLLDPFGHSWMLSTHVEDVSEQELSRRAKELFGG
ncbi:PhnB protein [Alkalimonas amylolytica]|uniref:PhnB protein n=2 Tax=Alkalimonas amylolytica TaxID=152573 RepID=A0A1H3ZJP1_ALKAM|nr:VOC family protein [Alkalimonas amylolytica]SEA23474.1 PhnB protein [Alkalimonas amylolytica]